MDNAVLSLRNVRKSYREADGNKLDVIQIGQFDLGAGEQTALVGASGSGKSTLLNLIAGILLPDAGEVKVNGTEITKLPEARRDRFRATNIGYVFQSFNLLQGFTALENVLLGQMFGTGGNGNRAVQLLKSVGLEHRLHHKPRALSVGEQQRVAIARALVNAPSLVLADEPTGSLDAKNGAAVLDLLRQVCADGKHTLLLVTHDPQVMKNFNRVVRLEELR
jgi:putative ABC transport system ATP-binding protein